MACPNPSSPTLGYKGQTNKQTDRHLFEIIVIDLVEKRCGLIATLRTWQNTRRPPRKALAMLGMLAKHIFKETHNRIVFFPRANMTIRVVLFTDIKS